MADMDVNSKEFATAATRAGQLKDQLNDAADAVKGSTGPAFESMNNTFSVMTGQIQNLDFDGLGQSFTSLGRSVSKINFTALKDEFSGLVKGLANLGKALLANPIFLLAAAIGGIVMYWDEISGAISGTTRQVEALTKANEDLARTNQNLEGRLKHEQAIYGNTLKTYELQTQIAKNNIKIAQNELDIAKTTKDIEKTREAENKLIEARNALTAVSDAQEKNRLSAVEQARQLTSKSYKEYSDNLDSQNSLVVARNQTLEEIRKKEKEIADLKDLQNTNDTYGFNLGEKKLVNNGAVLAKQNELNQLKQQEKDLTEGLGKLEEIRGSIGKKSAEELAKLEEERLRKLESDEIERRKKLKEAEEWEIELENSKLKRIDEVRAENYDAQLLKRMEVQSRMRELDERFSRDAIENEKWRLENERKIQDEKVSMSIQALTVIEDFTQLFDKKSEASAKRAFQLHKAASIAQAVIETYKGANAIFTAAALNPASVLFPAQPFINAGIAIASGLANVAKISQQQFTGGSTGGGGGVSSPSMGGGGTSNQPNPLSFSFLGNRPQQQPPIQAYVVSGQVNTSIEAQTLIRNQAKLH